MKNITVRTVISIVATSHPDFETRCRLVAEVLSKYLGNEHELLTAECAIILSLIDPSNSFIARAVDPAYNYLSERGARAPSQEIAGLSWLILAKNLPAEKRMLIGWEGRRDFHPIIALIIAEPGYDLLLPLNSYECYERRDAIIFPVILALLFKMYPNQISDILTYLFDKYPENEIWEALWRGYTEKLFERNTLEEIYTSAKDAYPPVRDCAENLTKLFDSPSPQKKSLDSPATRPARSLAPARHLNPYL